MSICIYASEWSDASVRNRVVYYILRELIQSKSTKNPQQSFTRPQKSQNFSQPKPHKSQNSKGVPQQSFEYSKYSQ